MCGAHGETGGSAQSHVGEENRAGEEKYFLIFLGKFRGLINHLINRQRTCPDDACEGEAEEKRGCGSGKCPFLWQVPFFVQQRWQVPFADKNGIENHRAIKIRSNKVKQDRICL